MYGLSCQEYDRLAERAAGRCEICGLPEGETPRGTLCIDHDQRYGYTAVRGLICDKCNAHMQRVDAGERPSDRAEREYCRRAWFVEVNEHRRGVSPLLVVHPDWDLWKRFGKAAGDRTTVTRALYAWYLRVPGAKLPKRPTPGE